MQISSYSYLPTNVQTFSEIGKFLLQFIVNFIRILCFRKKVGKDFTHLSVTFATRNLKNQVVLKT